MNDYLAQDPQADIWTLPSCQRLHAAVGKVGALPSSAELVSSDGRGSAKTGTFLLRLILPYSNGVQRLGIIMAMHLLSTFSTSSQPSGTGSQNQGLRLLCAYENGSVTLWSFTRTDKQTSVEGIGWEALWSVKRHVESGWLLVPSSPYKSE